MLDGTEQAISKSDGPVRTDANIVLRHRRRSHGRVDFRYRLDKLEPDRLAAFLKAWVDCMDDYSDLSDHFLMRMYEGIRNEVNLDLSRGTQLVGDAARQRAEQLRAEIERRGLFCAPIVWPA
ncbi:hypothetical protein [Bradyrhizobium sp. I71]|uniref:hypothetical protein n=1 Tax=Bradyrhizobium sp. I71 TaxID=2590772 RepID=UPI001EF8AD4F|nr:hypothetical protein [Bradyrhizobium sp. I71]ULK95973.1 hypothetical protein FJV43_24880 [Bradyrhizobium sp. I71]